MSPAFSVYLDLLRVLAASMVVVYHLKTLGLGPTPVRALMPGFGHEFVIVFFVLSGFVIALAVDRKPQARLSDYLLDRAARLYSVALPCLIVSALVSVALGLTHGHQAPGAGSAAQIAVGTLASALMLGQAWALDAFPPSNPPFWSLCYEAMYYLIFGLAVYLRGPRRWVAVAAACLLAGPKVLLLLPCWLLGVAAYRWRDAVVLRRWQAWVLAWGLPALVFYVLSKAQVGRLTGGWIADVLGVYATDLARSDNFLKDYLSAALVALHLFAVRQLPLRWPAWVARGAQAAAGLTFTLYLLHYPLLLAVATGSGAARVAWGALGVALVLVMAATWLMGTQTELRRGALRIRLARWAGQSTAPVVPSRA